MLEVWAVQNCITHNALHDLLCLLHKLHPNLPKDPRTLFSLSYEFTIDNIAGDQYYHFGIASTLSHQFQLKLYSKINLHLICLSNENKLSDSDILGYMSV